MVLMKALRLIYLIKIQMFVIWILTNLKRKFILYALKTIDFISLYIVEKVHSIYL